MRIVSYNVNGIRAAIKKGLLEWLSTEKIDILCVQETKATKADVDTTAFEKLGYHVYWFAAQKKGYSGVAVFTKEKPLHIVDGQAIEQSDAEGRVIQLHFKKFTLVNAYFPSGTSGDERQTYKYTWLKDIEHFLQELQKKQPNIILTGDYNIAHTEIDIHDPKGNKNSSGFLPEEREWMTQFLQSGWIDTFRQIHPTTTGAFSWWSQRFPTVRLQNKGWRIDYICTTKSLQKNIVDAGILPDAKHSDHCPIWTEIKL